jgi:hypothetical protein
MTDAEAGCRPPLDGGRLSRSAETIRADPPMPDTAVLPSMES